MEKSRIDWTDSTWNPVTGCYHDCKYCYARGITARFGDFMKIDGTDIKMVPGRDGRMCIEVAHKTEIPYPEKFTPTLYRHRLKQYAKKKGRVIFVCSMADLFGEWVPDEWIRVVFEACAEAPQGAEGALYGSGNGGGGVNKRQRKKAFKKVFGMNQAQYEKWYREHWSEIMSETIRRNTDALNEGLKELRRAVVDAVEIVKMGIDKWAEEIRVAAGFIETTEEEKACIRYHMGAFANKEEWEYYTRAVKKYPNVLYTHTADMLATHVKGV